MFYEINIEYLNIYSNKNIKYMHHINISKN